MPNDILNTVCAFDWITPTIYILQDFFNGPVSRFGIQANVGFDRGDIKRLLSKYGVESWGYIYNVAGDLIMLSVPQKQANWAYYLLQREGIPILFAPDEAIYSPKKSNQNTNLSDPFESVFKFLDKLEKDIDW